MSKTTANDGYTNLVSGMEESANKADRINVVLHDFSHIALLYRTDFMARQVVDVPADDATRGWRQWMASDKQITALENEEKRLRVRDRVRHAYKWARLKGGAAIIIHDGTERDQMDQPFDPATVKKGGLKALVVASRDELKPTNSAAYVTDPESRHYLMPEEWTYSPRRGGAHTSGWVIHHSRIVFIRRGDVTDDVVSEWWWGESVLDPLVRLIAHASESRAAAAHLMQEANVDVLKVQGLNSKIQTSDGEAQALKYAGLIRTSKDIYRMAMVDSNDDLDRKAYAFTGVKDVVTTLHDYVAAGADIPATRMLGRPPQGMNATGEHDMLNYFQMLESEQASCLEPALADLDEALIRSALGNRPQKVWFEWRRPDLLTEQQRTEQAKVRSEIVKNYKASATVPSPVMEAAVRSLLIEHGDLPGAEMAYAAWDEAGNEIDFEDDGGINPQEGENQNPNPDDPPVDDPEDPPQE